MDVIQSAFTLIVVHIVGFFIFRLLWNLAVSPAVGLPILDWENAISVYLMIDVLFFLMSKFDNVKS